MFVLILSAKHSHLLKSGPDDGDPVFDGGDGVRVTHGQDSFPHVSSLVDIHPLRLYATHEVPMCVQQGLQCLCLFRQDTPETECLFCLREPLQNHLNSSAKLLRLVEVEEKPRSL